MNWFNDYLLSIKDRQHEIKVKRSLNILGLTEKELKIIRRIKSIGEKDYARKVLKLDKKDFVALKIWSRASFPQKMEQLIQSKSKYTSIWTFLARCLIRYDGMSRKVRSRWGKSTDKANLTYIAGLVHNLDTLPEDKEKIENIIIRLYYLDCVINTKASEELNLRIEATAKMKSIIEEVKKDEST